MHLVYTKIFVMHYKWPPKGTIMLFRKRILSLLN